MLRLLNIVKEKIYLSFIKYSSLRIAESLETLSENKSTLSEDILAKKQI